MRVLHVTTYLQGGAGRIISSLAIAQQRRGHDVRVATDAEGEPGYTSYPEYLEALASAGVPVIAARSMFKRDPALNRSAAETLKRALRGWPPDLVHAHAATPAVIARIAGVAGPTAAPVVHTMHGWGTTKTTEQASADLAVLGMADAIVTPSDASRCALIELGLQGPAPEVIAYGIAGDPDASEPDEADRVILERLGGARRRVLCIGTIGARKNQRLLVEALAVPALQDAAAVFIGDGDTRELERDARDRGIHRRIAVLGYRPRAHRYLPFARALVLPSRNEGLPLAVLEAMRAGIPVVASRIPELAEALDDGRAGHLFEPESAADLARALRTAFDDGDSARRAVELRARFDARYSHERMVVAYEELYERHRRGRERGRGAVAHRNARP